MRRIKLAPVLAAPLLAAAALAMPVEAAAPGAADGIWLNPYRTVAVRTGACGERLCGWVVWASGDAQQDARDSGTARLVGTQLLQDYQPSGPRSWTGTVFVPDMNRRFSSQIDAVSPTQLQIKGCILGGLICKSQTWTRIERLPQ